MSVIRIEGKHWHNVLFARQGNEITDVLTCSQPGDVPSAYCRHYFNTPVFSVEYSFPREVLVRWRDHRVKVARFVACLNPETRIPGG